MIRHPFRCRIVMTTCKVLKAENSEDRWDHYLSSARVSDLSQRKRVRKIIQEYCSVKNTYFMLIAYSADCPFLLKICVSK